MEPELIEKVMQLPFTDRAALAHQLLLSLDSKSNDCENEVHWSEIQRRTAEVRSGQSNAREWSDAIADIRNKLSRGVG